jgi:type IV secretion system protein TrbL
MSRLAVAVALLAARDPSPTPTPTGTGAPAQPNPFAPPMCRFIKPAELPKYPQCNTPATGGSGVIGHLVGSAVDQVASAFAKAEVQITQMLMTWWTRVPGPSLSDSDPASPVRWLQDHTWWYTSAVAIFGLLIAAGRLAWQRRGEPVKDALSGLLTLVIVTGCGVAAVNLAVQAGHAYTIWIIDQSIGPGGTLIKSVALVGAAANALAPGLVIILAVIAIVSSLIQMALMLVRVAVVGLLAGIWPLSAAAAVTPEGRGQYRKTTGWLIAFVLYEPASGTIYAYGFRAMTAPDELSQLSGIITIVLAVVALPALMRLVTPLVSPTAASGGGAAAMAGFAGAMGARMVPAGRGAGGGGAASMNTGSAGGSAGPAGADPAAGGTPRGPGGAPGGGTGNGKPPPGPSTPAEGGQPPGGPSGAPTAPIAGGSAASGAAAAFPAATAAAAAM